MACASVELLLEAPTAELRPEDERPPAGAPGHLLIVGIDGLRRDVFLDALRGGELPGFEKLLGGRRGADLPHAHVYEQTIAPFPSVTASGWAALMTGEPPARNGVTGNEMLLRPSGHFVAPVPMSVNDKGDLLAVYNDQLFSELIGVPTIYDGAHRRGQRSWVAFNHVYDGADRLLMPGKADLLEGLMETLMGHVIENIEEDSYGELDNGTLDTVFETLEDEEFAPNILTVYLSGTDLVGHIASGRVQDVQRAYLRNELDDRMGELDAALKPSGPWYRVVIADHGHTEVIDDDEHAISPGATGGLADLLAKDGFEVHAPALGKVEGRSDTVIAYQSGAAFIYLADRSTCGDGGCRWDIPPRYDEDVLAAAEAIHRAARDGGPLADRVDLVLVREPVPFEQEDRPFVVYREGGETISPTKHLAATATEDPRTVALAERLQHLAVGRYGERAGDVLVVAHMGDHPDDRYYFAKPYASTHGSAVGTDSYVPFVVAHPERSSAQLRNTLRAILGERAHLHELAPLFKHLLTEGR